MVRPERFELPTYSSGGCRSIQLSYGRVTLVYIGTAVRPRWIGAPPFGKERRTTTPVLTPKSQEPTAKSRPRLSPSAISAPTAAARPLRLRTRFVHIDCAPTDLCPVQPSDGFLTLLIVCHFNKRE